MNKHTGFSCRTTLAGITFALAGVFFGNVAFAADDVGSLLSEKLKKFTPADLMVVAPTNDVPKECAAFSGEWGPALISRLNMALKMVVKSVAPDCTINVVIVWAEPRSFANDPGAGSTLHTVKIVNGGFQVPGLSAGSTLDLKMKSTGDELNAVATNVRGQGIYFKFAR